MPEKYKVGPHEVELVVPAAFSIRREIALAFNQNRERAFFAALAACWKGPGRPKARYDAHDYNPLKFGGAVMDELHAAGIDVNEAIAAGAAAWMLLSASVFAPDIKAAAVPSEPEGGEDAPPATE
jgi:hypothetical protein